MFGKRMADSAVLCTRTEDSESSNSVVLSLLSTIDISFYFKKSIESDQINF